MFKGDSHMSGYNVLVVFYVACGAIFYGYDSALTTSIFGYPQFIEFFNLDAVKLGAIGSCYYAGLTVGCIWNWWFPNRYGRLNDIRLACVIGIIAASIQTGAQSFQMLLAGRVIGGIACGIVFSICPTYASEVSPPSLRGRVGAFYNLVLSSSYAVTEWMGLGLSYVSGNAAWQIFIGLQLVAPVIMLAGSFFMHESPRYLVLKNRPEEALEVLKKMHGSSDDKTFYLREFHQIKTQLALEKAQNVDFKTIFTKKSYRFRFLLITIVGSMAMLTGVIALQNYQYFIYVSLGITNKTALALAGVWGTVLLPMIILGGYFFDKIGRKKSVYISMGICMTASTMLTVCWARYSGSDNTNKSAGRAAVFSMFLFICGYSWIMNAMQYTYPAEICPANIRHIGSAWVQTVSNIWIIIIVQVAPIAIAAIGWKFFMIFLFFDLITLTLVIFLFPETNGKTLEEIAALFGDDITETLEEAGQHLNELHEFGIDAARIDNVNLTQSPGEGVFENKAGHHTHVDHVEKV